MSITNCHLHAYSEDARLIELKQLLEQRQSTELQIIVGDLNSLHRNDNYRQSDLECEARFDVIDRLEGEFIDVFSHCLEPGFPTFPTASNIDPDHNQPRRIDYCFINKALANHPISCRVIRSALTELASDHYPLEIDFA